jgi:glucokinase
MYILFDIGATKTRIARVTSSDSFETPIIYETPGVYEDGIKILRENISILLSGESADAIVGCIAGPWNVEKGTITESGNLSGWHNMPLKNDLRDVFKTDIIIDNDAAMVGLGEAIFGAGRGFGSILYMTVSTGVGGAIISQGNIKARLEPRKQVMSESGETLEYLISGRGVEKKTGKKPEDITDSTFWDSLAEILAHGLKNIVLDYLPDVVVIGGSMMNKVGISIEATEKYLQEILKGTTKIPTLKHSELGDLGGLYGALAKIKS